jgi:hypothetical protein
MPKININMQWLIPLATGVWAVWTWAAGQERDRNKEHARISALYVKPLLSACEDLQSRIYSILEIGGLRTLRKRYPDGSYAEETLYLIVRYFGWMLAAERHGPSTYIEDPVVIRLTSAVCSAFATASSAQQVGPFNFFHPEQKDLGKLLLTKFDGPYGVEFDTISCHEFKKRLASPPLPDSEAVKETLEALRSADDATTLPGRDRLVEVQNHLVELLAYLEKKEGYTLFQGERKKCGTPTQPRAAAGNQPSPALST